MCPQTLNLAETLPQPISVVIADDHPFVSCGIVSILEAQADIEVVVACSNGKAAAAAIRQFTPDVAVLDIGMPDLNVPDVLSSIASDGIKTKVVCLTATPTGQEITAAIALGALGVILKNEATDSIVDCVRNVFHGKRWFPVILRDAGPKRDERVRKPQSKLFRRA